MGWRWAGGCCAVCSSPFTSDHRSGFSFRKICKIDEREAALTFPSLTTAWLRRINCWTPGLNSASLLCKVWPLTRFTINRPLWRPAALAIVHHIVISCTGLPHSCPLPLQMGSIPWNPTPTHYPTDGHSYPLVINSYPLHSHSPTDGRLPVGEPHLRGRPSRSCTADAPDVLLSVGEPVRTVSPSR